MKIFVGMSGGVDSSVSAALLKKAGHDVTGVFIRVWQPDWIECNWREERLEAMRAAAHLEIPFATLDLEAEYKRGVIDYMIAEYAAGRTPNPDVMCNREVKFGAFWKWAQQQGADAIATGHYARNESGRLLKGVDENKDQSYFLWTLNQDDLAHALFPVGGLTKPEVRKLAKKFGLPNADKKDSQGLCFIGKVDVKEFLTHYVDAKAGDVLNEKGEVIGTHPGALLFTIGERHGFTVSQKTPNDEPLYVVSKDVTKNTLIVSHTVKINELDAGTEKRTATIRNVSWSNKAPQVGQTYEARTRYRQPLEKMTMKKIDGTTTTVEFAQPQATLTPGQSLVMYDGDECLGGGILV